MAKTRRVDVLQQKLLGIKDPDEIMKIIQNIFTETVPVPNPGQAYTFVYKKKTPGIEYDQHPLIITDSIIGTWGFRGFNIHWNDYRNYTWPEVQGKFHVVNKGNEFDFLCTVPYMKRLIN